MDYKKEEPLVKMSHEEVLEVAIAAGKVSLCSGAETYRVEDTMARMCAVHGMNSISAFCTPAVIIVSDEASEGYTYMYRVMNHSTNLSLVSEINDISFNFAKWPHDYKETMEILQEKLNRPPRPKMIDILSSAIGGGAFAIVLGGGFLEFFSAFIAAFIATLVTKWMTPFRPSSFWETTVAGATLCIVIVVLRLFIPAIVMDRAIGAALMPYVPGMSFTNGLRDYMAGDLMSGNARVSEAMLLVLGLAVGIAVVLSGAHKLGLL